jgi:hypothetical protein
MLIPVANRTMSYREVLSDHVGASGAVLAQDELLAVSPQSWAYAELAELLRLKDGWNGHGAGPPTRIAVRVAGQVLSVMPPRAIDAVTIVPTNRAGVQLEWHGRGIDVEVEVEQTGKVQCAVNDETDELDAEGGFADCLATIQQALARIS